VPARIDDGVIGVTLVPISCVSPAAQKRHFNLVAANTKNARQAAIRIWPIVVGNEDHNKAETALRVPWGQRAAMPPAVSHDRALP
jgi:hypothetical protein